MQVGALRGVFVERFLLTRSTADRSQFGARTMQQQQNCAGGEFGALGENDCRELARTAICSGRYNLNQLADHRTEGRVSHLVLEATCRILIGRQDRCLMKNVDDNVTLGDVESAGVSPAMSFESRFRSSTVHLPRSFVNTSWRLCLMPVHRLGRRNYAEESQIWIA